MAETRTRLLETPLGLLRLAATGEVITGLAPHALGTNEVPGQGRARDALLDEAEAQVRAYFDGRLRRFTLPLRARTSAAQHGVLEGLFAIRYGETRSYGALAEALGTAPRAVGRACAANPILLMIPCHRVVSARGPGGYAAPGGARAKALLLSLEARAAAREGLPRGA